MVAIHSTATHIGIEEGFLTPKLYSCQLSIQTPVALLGMNPSFNQFKIVETYRTCVAHSRQGMKSTLSIQAPFASVGSIFRYRLYLFFLQPQSRHGSRRHLRAAALAKRTILHETGKRTGNSQAVAPSWAAGPRSAAVIFWLGIVRRLWKMLEVMTCETTRWSLRASVELQRQRVSGTTRWNS